MNRHELVELGIALYKNPNKPVGKFSSTDADSALREGLIELNGGNINFKDFRRNKVEFFEFIEEIVQETVQKGITDEFDAFAEIKNLSWGEQNKFIIPNRDLFKVATISDGNLNTRKQRLTGRGELVVPVYNRVIAIYDELYRFLAGRIDWVDALNRISRSFVSQLKTDVYTTLYASFSAMASPYKVSAAFDRTELLTLCMHVEAKTGSPVVILGTKLALSQVVPNFISENMKSEANNQGFYASVDGYDMIEIKQTHSIGTDTFAINDSFLLVVPTGGEKIVKIVNEGETLIYENMDGNKADMNIDYKAIMRLGVAVIPSAEVGVYLLA